MRQHIGQQKLELAVSPQHQLPPCLVSALAAKPIWANEAAGARNANAPKTNSEKILENSAKRMLAKKEPTKVDLETVP